MSDIKIGTLSREEVELILRQREKVVARTALIEKQANCKHEWLFTGRGHCEDIYECIHCHKLMKK